MMPLEAALNAKSNELEEIRYAIDQHSIYVETDVRGTITDVNNRFCEVSGFEREELLGKNHRILNSGLHPQSFWQHMYRTVAKGEVWRGDICNLSKLGEPYWVTTTIIPKKSSEGKVIGYRALRTEITEKVRQRQALEATLDKQKDMFAVIGHELRTPVATISMIAEDESRSDREKLAQIKEISENLLHVLEDLRVVVSPGRALESKTVTDDPIKIVTRAVSPLSQLAHVNEMQLSLDMKKTGGRKFVLNGQALRQSVTNLVKNALIHSGGTEVCVSFNYETDAHKVTRAILRVEDDGKGIPEHLQERVFAAFGRGETTEDGSGLGLFIVKQISEMLSGELSYSQSTLGGACFELSFPMTPAVSEELPSPILPTYSLSGVRVLLAEDDRLLRMLTETMLTKEGASVLSFENGQLALNAFEPEKFDLVITDLMMPEMNGHELTTAIRALSSKTIIVAVTAAVMGQETTRFMQEGADFVLPKPLSTKTLTAALTEIMHRRSHS